LDGETERRQADAADATAALAAETGRQAERADVRRNAHVPVGGTDAATSTGDPRVDDALSRLRDVDGLPLGEQVEVYADIHRRLSAVLADPDSRA
jgi:hypothetical protein